MKENVKKIYSAGVVGAGGAGFPTHIKAQCKAAVVIANGAECEPLLCNDKILLKTHTKEILYGLDIMASATGARRKVIAVKEKYRDVIEKLLKEAKTFGVEIFPLQNYYPAGDEHEIVNYVTGQIVAEMGIPPQIGVVMDNIETLLNVAASQTGNAVTHRYVSLIGEIDSPAVYHVPIGTSVQFLIECAGGVKCENPAIILGGAMMGKLCLDFSTTITKTTSAVLVLPQTHPLIQLYQLSYSYSLSKAKSACTQCTLCTDICSRYLLGHRLYPHKIMLLPDVAMDVDSWLLRSALLCSDCGCCEYACPMGLSPRKVIRVIKSNLRLKKFAFDVSGYQPRLHPERDVRRIPVDRLIQRLKLAHYSSSELHLAKKHIQPDSVEIPLKQHIGSSATSVVKNQVVQQGDIIAIVPAGQTGACIHASISGRVVSQSDEMIKIKAH
jgi:Na+-translocating ferredoxin:NAD+ oxidoreductase RnfC subunit